MNFLGERGKPDTCDHCGRVGVFMADLHYLYEDGKAKIVHGDCKEIAK